MRLFAFTTALLTACLFSNTASALTYNCEVEPSREGAWIGSQLIIRHNETTGEVTVLDNLIQHYIGDAIEAEIETENSKRITFIWKLENFGSSATDDLQFTSGFFFRATVRKSNHKVSVSSKPLGYRNTFSGKGSCTVR